MKSFPQHTTYIWQSQDWPNFRWDADVLIDPMSRINMKRGRLSGIMSLLGFDSRGNARLDAMTDEIVSSSQIEGVTLNAKSVRSSIGRRLGIEDDGMLAEDHYVEGLVDVMMDALNLNTAALTEERLFSWHSALFPTGRSGMYKITVGNWREGDEPMQVVSGAIGKEKVHYQAPDSKDVPDEMKRFLSWVNTSDLNPVLKAAVAHIWLVTIHPFDDGNGRICRSVTDMILSRADSEKTRYFSMSAEINRNKKQYYDMLERSQKGSLDITEWILWFFGALESAVDHTLSKVSRTVDKAQYWDRFRLEEINERQRKVINRLWDGFDGKLTSSKWAKICHCSQDTAQRDISGLVVRGMLCDSGAGGRSKNYLLPEMENSVL